MKRHSVHGIYLAAGQSSRMGTNKLGLPLRGIALGNHALLAALQAGLAHVWIVTAEGKADWLDAALGSDRFRAKWTLVRCPDAHSGQAHSIRCGVEAAMTAGAESVMILLADQPFVTAAMINELLCRYDQASEREEIHFAAAEFGGLARPPVICHRRMFPELLRLQGDQGARQLIRHGRGISVPFGSPDLFLDVDTPED
ncbi:nucleotidyltransferase family protein [Paenibacillus sp. AR247]|uniref:nucleotidyltransferase family protein n=1 Tax=Paenibacillus sp. AR247 TaxID=1631599 RepID=UPI00280A8748|nr:nucleotidyltransferase family protein [Paenibacillus sp. AR247]